LILIKGYTQINKDEIHQSIYWCEEHGEYFSNNCSECMLLANAPETIRVAQQSIITKMKVLRDKLEDEWNNRVEPFDPEERTDLKASLRILTKLINEEVA